MEPAVAQRKLALEQAESEINMHNLHICLISVRLEETLTLGTSCSELGTVSCVHDQRLTVEWSLTGALLKATCSYHNSVSRAASAVHTEVSLKLV